MHVAPFLMWCSEMADQTQPRVCYALDPGKEKTKSVNSGPSHFVRPLLGLLIESSHGIRR